MPEKQSVNIRNRSYSLGALVDIPAPGAEGVLFAHGARFGAPVTDDYPGESPYRFTGGVIKQVRVNVSGKPYLDLEREAVAMLMRE